MQQIGQTNSKILQLGFFLIPDNASKFNDCDKIGPFFLKWSWGTNFTLLFSHLAPISCSYSSDFAYQLYPSLIVKKL